jgi:hypothetical protein
MKWLAATVALVGASVALVLGIYFRDRDPGHWLPSQPRAAHLDAMAVAAEIGGTCPRDCRVKLLGHPRANHWTERITVPTATECVDINVLTFATDETHGVAGVTAIRCDVTP